MHRIQPTTAKRRDGHPADAPVGVSVCVDNGVKGAKGAKKGEKHSPI